MTVVLNADDPSVAALRSVARGPVVLYGVDDRAAALARPEHAADSRWCPDCGSEYRYQILFYGHIGHWRCPGCGQARPQPAVRARSVRFDPGGDASLTVDTPAGEASLALQLGGLYNAYNALAAARRRPRPGMRLGGRAGGGIAPSPPPSDVRSGSRSTAAGCRSSWPRTRPASTRCCAPSPPRGARSACSCCSTMTSPTAATCPGYGTPTSSCSPPTPSGRWSRAGAPRTWRCG